MLRLMASQAFTRDASDTDTSPPCTPSPSTTPWCMRCACGTLRLYWAMYQENSSPTVAPTRSSSEPSSGSPVVWGGTVASLR